MDERSWSEPALFTTEVDSRFPVPPSLDDVFTTILLFPPPGGEAVVVDTGMKLEEDEEDAGEDSCTVVLLLEVTGGCIFTSVWLFDTAGWCFGDEDDDDDRDLSSMLTDLAGAGECFTAVLTEENLVTPPPPLLLPAG